MKRINHLCASRSIGALAAAAVALSASQAVAQEKETEAPEKRWYDAIEVGAFVDGYASLNLNFPKPETDQNLFRANDTNNGFSLAWAGLDLTYDAAPVGATLALRFGPQALSHAGGDLGLGLEYVRQAFVTWTPTENLTLDFGKWDTVVGIEALDSQENINYTRGVLYWLSQPTFHTGLRARYTFNEQLDMLAFVVNGVNVTADNNLGKTFGYQINVTPSDLLSVSLAYIGGPEQPDTEIVTTPEGEEVRSIGGANKRFRHFVDLFATINPNDDLSILLNAELGLEDVVSEGLPDAPDPVKWFGVLAGVRYAFTENLAAAYRAELYLDPDGFTSGLTDAEGRPLDLRIITNTLTLEASPTPNLIVKLDGRIDLANESIYPKGIDETRTILPTVTLGVVAKTN